MNIPKWVWTILWVCIVLIVIALLKFHLTIGPEGISTGQGLVH